MEMSSKSRDPVRGCSGKQLVFIVSKHWSSHSTTSHCIRKQMSAANWPGLNDLLTPQLRQTLVL